MKEGVSFYHVKANILRFFTCVRHFVAGVMLNKSFSVTNPEFSIEGIGYCSGTSIADAIGAKGDGVVPGKLVAWTGWLARLESMDNGWRATGNQQFDNNFNCCAI